MENFKCEHYTHDEMIDIINDCANATHKFMIRQFQKRTKKPIELNNFISSLLSLCAIANLVTIENLYDNSLKHYKVEIDKEKMRNTISNYMNDAERLPIKKAH